MNGDQARVIRVNAHAFAVVKRSQMLRLFATREQAEAYAKRA